MDVLPLVLVLVLVLAFSEAKRCSCGYSTVAWYIRSESATPANLIAIRVNIAMLRWEPQQRLGNGERVGVVFDRQLINIASILVENRFHHRSPFSSKSAIAITSTSSNAGRQSTSMSELTS